mgnify:CR=1 FL=1
MSRWNKFRWVEWPRLATQLPQVCGLVFMLCFTSFATVMALGGGPKSTTIELAIYQAIKFDFDLQTGALLAMWQMLLCGVLAISIQKLSKPLSVTSGSLKPLPMYSDSRKAKAWDTIWIGLVMMLVLPPLTMVVLSGLNSKVFIVLSDGRFWNAVHSSLTVAITASSSVVITGCVDVAITAARAHKKQTF